MDRAHMPTIGWHRHDGGRMELRTYGPAPLRSPARYVAQSNEDTVSVIFRLNIFLGATLARDRATGPPPAQSRHVQSSSL